MDSLIVQTLEFLKQEAATNRFVLATPEEVKYFSPRQQTPPSQKNADPMPQMRGLVSKILPEIEITTHIPDDAMAKKAANLWKEDHLIAKALVLSFGETGPALQFLQNVVKAIDTLLVPARLLEMRRAEREKSWEMTLSSPALQLVIAPPFQEWKNISLSRFYRENPTSQTHFLKEIPVLLLKPASAYLSNPDLKRELWNNLSSLLSSST